MSPTVRAAWLLSIAAWLIPIVVVQVLRSRRGRALWEIALDVPFAVGLDLLGILVLTRVVTLERAVLASRVAWVVGGAALGWWRWKRFGYRPRWPIELGATDLLAATAASALAVGSSAWMSYDYLVWDHNLHVPNVSAIASQKLPFINALSGTEVLHYHFTGDVLAAALRTLSFDVVSSMRALHTGHDLMLAAVAGTVTLLSIGLGLRRRWSAALGGVAVVLNGPIPLRGGLGHYAFLGYTYNNFPNLSYRPHVPLAALLLVGALGTVAVRATQPDRVPTRATAPVLFAVMALLSVTDETSTGLLGLGLGVAWLLDPRLLAQRRITGLALLLVVGAAFAGTNLLFAASLAPGTPVQSVAWTPAARVPALLPEDHDLPLSEPHGWTVLFVDYLPLLACGAALVLLAVARRSRAHAALAALAWSVIAISAGLLLRVEINHYAAESQRFLVAPFFACVVLTVFFLHQMPRGSVASSLALLGVAVPAVYSAYWVREQGPAVVAGLGLEDKATESSPKLNDIDCRASADAHYGDRPRVAYVESSEFYRVVGCRPIFNSGIRTGWSIPTHPTTDPIPQLRALDENLVRRDEETAAFCLRDEKAPSDPVCRRALRVRSSCRPEGERFLRCPLTPADREALLR
jgi:hypothetical protein